MYAIVLASVYRQLALGLSYMNTVAIKGSQIIAFLAYQPLTLPPELDPLSPTTFWRLLPAPGYHIPHLTLSGENSPTPSMNKQCLFQFILNKSVGISRKDRGFYVPTPRAVLPAHRGNLIVS